MSHRIIRVPARSLNINNFKNRCFYCIIEDSKIAIYNDLSKECDGMKKWIALILTFCCMLSLVACNAQKTDVPDDFSFAITWNCYGISSYDSQTGKLVKTTDATNPDDYVTYYQLTDEDKEYFYKLITSLDVNSYPDIYNPRNGMSKPSMTLVLTVRMNDEVKTIKAQNIALSFDSKDKKGQQFLSVCETISSRLMETEEWKALPAYENLYE